jgi:DNA-binding winged helix-turn-helix (wHTH) protein/tetratricopeptide (TPR) repeat protein
MEVTFGPFRLDPAESRLLRDGAAVRLRPRAFRVLATLLRHGGRPVGYDQMIAEAWDGTVVSRHTVDVTVGEVRKSLGEYGTWITTRSKVGYQLDLPVSDELVRTGWHFWSQRTREGGERALECFRRAAEACPADFQAWEGLSASYLMLATFGMRAPREMLSGFLAAHEQAVAVGGLRPELRCNRGYALHLFERRIDEAEREFVEALREKPAHATAHVRLAMLYGAQRRFAPAHDILAQGYQADPLLPTLPVMEATTAVWERNFARAVDVGARTVELHPYLQIARAIYGEALRFSGRAEEALVQYRRGSVMSPDLPWLRALEGSCLADLGRTEEARAIRDQLEALRDREYVDAYHMAALRLALGDRHEALAELERAVAENSAWLYALDVDPKMDAIRDDLGSLTGRT